MRSGATLEEPTKVPPPSPLLVTVKDARRILGVGTTTIYRLIKSGALETRKIGARTLVTMKSVRRVAEEGAS